MVCLLFIYELGRPFFQNTYSKSINLADGLPADLKSAPLRDWVRFPVNGILFFSVFFPSCLFVKIGVEECW